MIPDEARGLDVPERCRLVGEVLARIGDKWSVLVVMTLSGAPLRFNELRRGDRQHFATYADPHAAWAGA